jgi:cytosine/adenosine deaminase-related metal-dependent hydrolase
MQTRALASIESRDEVYLTGQCAILPAMFTAHTHVSQGAQWALRGGVHAWGFSRFTHVPWIQQGVVLAIHVDARPLSQ